MGAKVCEEAFLTRMHTRLGCTRMHISLKTNTHALTQKHMLMGLVWKLTSTCRMRFTFAIWFELPYYALAKQRYSLFSQCAIISSTTLFLHYYMYQMNPTGAYWVFVFPFMVTSFALMFGNWSQHIFVHPDAGESSATERRTNFRHTYNVLDSPYNQMTFNDGYHVEHHLNSKKHWTELPDSCARTLQEYEKESAVLFRKLDFFLVGVLVFTGWWSMLVKHFVDVQSPRRSDTAIEALLKSRLAPIKRRAKAA